MHQTSALTPRRADSLLLPLVAVAAILVVLFSPRRADCGGSDGVGSGGASGGAAQLPSPRRDGTSGASLALALNETRTRERSLRRMLARAVCTGSADATSPSGGWCLTPCAQEHCRGGDGLEIPQHHVPGDAGLGRLMYETFRGARVAELGAGVGQYGHLFRRFGGEVAYTPFDGALNVEEFTAGRVAWMDLSTPFTLAEQADWIMSIEVGEHLPKEFEATYLSNVARNARCGAVLTWGVPGQGGHSHVNCRPSEYIKERMRELGFDSDEAMQAEGRAAASYAWLKSTFMFFRRRGAQCS